MFLLATPLSARADNPSTEGPLINTGSAMCFEPTPQGGSSDWAGLPIQQRACSPHIIRNDGTDDRPIQFYQFESVGFVAYNDQSWCHWLGCITDGTKGFLIRNVGTRLCLDVRDGSKSDKAVVQQWTCKGINARSMLWYVQAGDFPGMFKLRNFNSDRCLDVKGGSSHEFAQLQQYHCTSNNLAQNFGQKFPEDWPVTNVNGTWTDGSTRSAVIYAGLGSIIIDMSAFNRPAARGRVFGGCFIDVNFPDDATFTGDVLPCFTQNPTTIKWSNGSIWTKKL
jgi:hypothetical protein